MKFGYHELWHHTGPLIYSSLRIASANAHMLAPQMQQFRPAEVWLAEWVRAQ